MECFKSTERSVLRADPCKFLRGTKKCDNKNRSCEVMKKATGMHGASELKGLGLPRCPRNPHQSRSFVFHLAFLFILAISLLPLPLQAQDEYFNHTELNWFTIETPHFFVHYHNGEERSARVVA